MPAPARDDQVQRHSICVWLKVASVINNWLCSCGDSRKLMSWGACIHLITREIVLSTISLANVKKKFCFVYFYCTSAERKFVTKKIADLGGLWHFGLMRERISMILTRGERVNVCLNPFSSDIRKDFRSLRFSLLMIEYFRCARTSSASFRFSFLSRNIYYRKREKEAGERDFHRTSKLKRIVGRSNGKCRKEWIETRISWLELMGLSAGKKQSLWSPAVADLNCSVVYALVRDRCLWATSGVAVKSI